MHDQIDQHQSALTAKSVNQLGFSLYRELSTQSNLVFSPLGVYCVLRMLLEGARGETHSAISQLLYQDSEPSSSDGFKLLLEELHSHAQLKDYQLRLLEIDILDQEKLIESGKWSELRDSSVEAYKKLLRLSISSGIWIQEGYPIKPEFINSIQSIMAADAVNQDFEGQPAQACERINTWITEQTHGKIGAMLSPSDISELTRSILVNALYFKAAWVRPFSDPRPGAFYLFDGTKIVVPMMETGLFGLNTIQQDDYWAVELGYCKSRYRESNFSMILVVPASPGIEPFCAIESHLSQGNGIFPEAEQRDVILSMPPFKILGCHSLAPILAGLGLGEIFNTGANFTGISDEAGFHVDSILQNSYIRVDQYGTEAAAATLGTAVGGMPKWIYLTIDRPFLFMLVEKESGLILFQGKVVNPLAE
jgi:serpin B